MIIKSQVSDAPHQAPSRAACHPAAVGQSQRSHRATRQTRTRTPPPPNHRSKRRAHRRSTGRTTRRGQPRSQRRDPSKQSRAVAAGYEARACKSGMGTASLVGRHADSKCTRSRARRIASRCFPTRGRGAGSRATGVCTDLFRQTDDLARKMREDGHRARRQTHTSTCAPHGGKKCGVSEMFAMAMVRPVMISLRCPVSERTGRWRKTKAEPFGLPSRPSLLSVSETSYVRPPRVRDPRNPLARTHAARAPAVHHHSTADNSERRGRVYRGRATMSRPAPSRRPTSMVARLPSAETSAALGGVSSALHS